MTIYCIQCKRAIVKVDLSSFGPEEPEWLHGTVCTDCSEIMRARWQDALPQLLEEYKEASK